jgi:hypothetical protein
VIADRLVVSPMVALFSVTAALPNATSCAFGRTCEWKLTMVSRTNAVHSSLAVKVMNCLSSNSTQRHGYLVVHFSSVYVVPYVGSGLATGCTLVQGVLPSV